MKRTRINFRWASGSSFAIVGTCFALAAFGVPHALAAPKQVNRPDQSPVVMASWAGATLVGVLKARFVYGKSYELLRAGISDRDQVSEVLTDGTCDVGIHEGPWGVPDYHRFQKAFGSAKKLTEHPLGVFAVYVVVNAANPVKHLTIGQLAQIYGGKTKDWGDVPGGTKGLPIRLYSPMFNRTGFHIVKRKVLQGYDYGDQLKNWKTQTIPGKADTLHMKRTPDGVIAAVGARLGAIGFFLFDHRKKIDECVRVIGVVPRRDKEPVLPSDKTIYEEKYPLCEKLTMYVRPNPRGAKVVQAFCRMTRTAKIAADLRRFNLFPEYDRLAYFASKKRLEAFRAGRGPVVSCAGTVKDGQVLMKDCAACFVAARALAQVVYRRVSQAEAVERFLSGKDPLLLLDEPLSEKTMKLHGRRWGAFFPHAKPPSLEQRRLQARRLAIAAYTKGNRPVMERPIDTGEGNVIAGCGTAVVVNAKLALHAMTTKRLRSILAGAVHRLGRPPRGKSGKARAGGAVQQDGRVSFCCLRVPGRGVRAFLAEMKTDRLASATRSKKDVAGVIADIAIGRNVIGFVDVADLPSNTPAVEILAISQGGKAVRPSAASLLDGSYPLSRQLRLYVSPKADKSARELAKFIVAGGCDEALTAQEYVALAPARRIALENAFDQEMKALFGP